MLSVRSFSHTPVRFASTAKKASPAIELGEVQVDDQLLTFHKVGEGIRISQSTGENTLQLQPKKFTLNGGALNPEARKGLIRTLVVLMENKDTHSFHNINGKTYNAHFEREGIVFKNPRRPLETLSIHPDLIRIADGQVSEGGRKDLITIMRKLLPNQYA